MSFWMYGRVPERDVYQRAVLSSIKLLCDHPLGCNHKLWSSVFLRMITAHYCRRPLGEV